MFLKIFSAVKGWLAKMGLIQSINSVTEFAAVIESQWMYNRVLIWRALYRGYLGNVDSVPFHDAEFVDVTGEKHHRHRATLMMPKIACEKMASLVFNEKCKINIGAVKSVGTNMTDSNTDDESSDNADIDTFSDNIFGVLSDNEFYKQFQRWIEYMFALGGLIAKPYVENDKIKIAWVTAQNFLPLESTNDNIRAGVFLDETRQGKKYYTHLEWHTWDNPDTYHIINELYVSDSPDDLGVKVSLEMLPQYKNMDKDIIVNGLTHPLFIYFKPNIANNFETLSPLGISLFSNSLDTLKSLDIAFDSFQREFALGKRRIIVPASAIRAIYDMKTGEVHRYFDTNDEVYQAMQTGEMDSEQIKDMAVALRVTDHVAAIKSLLDMLAMQMGFSSGTFTFDGQAVRTATEVISENSDTFRTKNAHETLIEHGIKELVDVIAQLADLYGMFPNPGAENYEVTVDFDDSIADDRVQNANFYVTMNAAGMIPKQLAIQRIFDVTEDQAKEWVQMIKDEQGQVNEQLMNGLVTGAEQGVKNADYQARS